MTLLIAAAHLRDWVSREVLFAMEALAVLLLIYGLSLVRRMRVPLVFLEEGLEQLRQGDYTTRYREPGLPELNDLMTVYNALLERLQQERLETGEALGLFRSLLEVTQIGVVIMDFDGRPRVINPAARRWLELDGEAAPLAFAELEGPIAEGLARLDTDEERLVTVAAGRRVRVRRGSFLDRGFLRDFYLVEELTEALEESERVIWERLIRAIAHEVNNTVAASDSLLDSSREDLAEATDDSAQAAANNIEIARQINRRLASFVKRYASLVHTRTLNAEPTDLHALTSAVVQGLMPKADSQGVSMELRFSNPLPLFELDGDLMQQAMTNILLNALEACGRGDRIEVTESQSPDGHWSIEVSDTANSLVSEELAFEPFHTTKPDGQGVGLMLVREILRRHDIDHTLRSANDRTVFELSLPPDRVVPDSAATVPT